MNIIRKIQELKEKRNAIILAHNYQCKEVQEIADIVGDSLELSIKASETKADTIVFCGVIFMAETAKILSPNKTVLIPREDANCQLANMAAKKQLQEFKSKHKDAEVICYINSNINIKMESDHCCTSSNALKTVNSVNSDKVIFVPDRNLAAYCQENTNKTIIPWNGFCYVHENITENEINTLMKKHPNAECIVHPECKPSIRKIANRSFSTGKMIKYIKNSNNTEFIIGTEKNLIHRLIKNDPNKKFYFPEKSMCINMVLTKLEDVYNCLNENKYIVEVEKEKADKIRDMLEEMIKNV